MTEAHGCGAPHGRNHVAQNRYRVGGALAVLTVAFSADTAVMAGRRHGDKTRHRVAVRVFNSVNEGIGSREVGIRSIGDDAIAQGHCPISALSHRGDRQRLALTSVDWSITGTVRAVFSMVVSEMAAGGAW